ncbi:MAG: fibronectin type III domain-containing protein [Ktedonobacteraceae bacterium]
MDAKLTLTFSYSDNTLKAAWPAQPDVYGYQLLVLDSAGTTVFSSQILQAEYQSPVIVQSPAFQPQLGATYTAEVYVIGPPSDRQSAEVINLEQPVLSFTESATGISFTWQTQALAAGYDVQIFRDLTLVLTRENQPGPVVLTRADGLAADTEYVARVRARAGNAFSAWSNAVFFSLTSARSILLALQQRLQNHRLTANTVALNIFTLPADLPGRPDQVLAIIRNSLKTDDLGITVSTPPTLNADNSQLSLVGTATILNAPATTIHLVFSVSDTRLLNLTLQADLPQNWSFAQSFPHQNLGGMALWDSTRPRFFLTSYAHTETSVFYPLAVGLNFLGTLRVANDLVPPSTEGAVIQTVDFGGPIDNLNTSVTFHFQGQHTLNDLTLKPLGWTPLTLKNGALLLDSVPSLQANTGNINAFRIRGTIAFSYGDLPFELAVPTKVPQSLNVVMANGGTANFATFQALVSVMPDNGIGQYLPASLQTLGGISLTHFSFDFDPAQDGSTISTVEVGSTDWDLSLFRLVKPKLALNSFISLDALGQQMRTDQLLISATLAIGTGTTFDVSLAVPSQGDWVLQIKNTQPTLQNLASFLGTTSTQLIAALPGPIKGMGTLAPTELRIGFNPFTPSWSFVAFTIQQVEKWTIVRDVVEVDHWSIDMVLAWQNGNWQADSLLEGDILLAGHPVHMTLPIPPGEQGWTLNFAQDPIIIPSFGELLTLIGAQQASNLLPQGVRDLGNLTITQMQINFDPSNTANPIRSLLFQINTSSPWTLIANENLVINSLQAGLKVSQTGGNFVTTGFIRGLLTVNGASVYIGTQRLQSDQPWLLALQTVRMIHVPGLAELAAWMLPQEMVAYIPVNFMPFSQGLDVTDFDVEFDLTNSTLNKIQFQIQNAEAWHIIDKYLSLDATFIRASIANPLSATPGLTAQMEGTVLLGNVAVTLSATKAVTTDPWVFRAIIAPNTVLNFESFFHQLTPSIAIPYDFGFPRSITIEQGSAMVTPANSRLHFNIVTRFDWQFDFALAVFRIISLNATLDVQAPNEQGVRPYTFQAGGSFSLAGIMATLSLMTSNGQTDTVLQATLTPENATSLNIATLANSLTTTSTGQGTKYESLPLPANVGIGFSQATLHLNLTKNIFMLFGQSKVYGSAGFLAFEKDASTWGYYVGAALADNFTFASITPSLSVVDGILHIKRAGLGIASTSIASLQQLVKDLPEFSTVVTVDSNGKPVPLQAGANLYGTLEFVGTLFANVPKILSGIEQKPSITIYAFIARDPGQSLFQASLDNFSLTQALVFNSITLRYTPRAVNVPTAQDQLELTGNMVVTVDANPYSFQSVLTVTNTKAVFHLDTTQQLSNPLGMFNILLKQLSLDMEYLFGETPSLEIRLSAQVGFGTAVAGGTQPVVLAGNLLFVDGTPKITEIALAQPLSVDDFFTTVLPAHVWPTGWIKVTFTTGRMYYSLVEGTYFGHRYLTGFNIESTVSIWNHIFTIAAQIQTEGVTIQGATNAAIDLTVAQLTNQAFAPTSSPSLFITTVGAHTRFGFDVGVILFKQQVGTASLAYVPATSRFEGTFIYNGKILDSQNPSITFAWSAQNGFEILGWNLSLLTAAYDFAKKIEELSAQFSSGSGCGKLVGMAFDQVITNRYAITIDSSVATSPLAPDKSTYRIPLKVTIQILVAGQTIIERAIPLPLVIQAPAEVSWSAVLSSLSNTVINSADAVVQEILQHPDQFAAFIGAAGLKQLVSTTVSSLLCRAVNSPQVESQAASTVAEETAAADAAADAAETAAVTAEGAIDATAAAAAATVAGGEVGTIVGIIGILAGLVAGLLALFGISKSQEEQRAEDDRARAQAAHDRTIQAVINKLQIASGSLTNSAGTTLHVQWNQVTGNGVTYEITLTKEHSQLVSQGVATNSFSFTDERVQPGATYTATVRAVLSYQNQSYQGQWTSMGLLIPVITSPTHLNVEQVQQSIRLTWEPGTPDTESYDVQVLDGLGKLLTPQPGLTRSGTTATVTGLTSGTKYIFEVRGHKGTTRSLWAQSLVTLYSGLAAPQSLALSVTFQARIPTIHATWQDNQLQVSYKLQVFNASGLLLSPQPAITIVGQTATITGPEIQTGQTYQVRVATVKDGQEVWSQLASITLQTQPQTLAELAQQLHGEGKTAQQAAPLLKQSFPTVRANEMFALLQATFPESTFSLALLAWALQQAGYSEQDAAATIGAAFPQTSLMDLATALKTGYPAQAVLTEAQHLHGANNSAQAAAQLLQHSHTDLTALQLAVVLVQIFTSTLATPVDMALALKNAGYAINDTSITLGSIYPLVPLTAIAAALHQVYQQ